MRRAKNKRILFERRSALKRMNVFPMRPRRETKFSGSRLRRHLAGEPVHLALHELPVKPLAPQKEIRRAVLHDLAELQHDNAVETPTVESR